MPEFLWPRPTRARQPCVRCGQPVALNRLVAGAYGRDCAERLGLIGDTTDVGHDGPDLLDLIEGDDLDEPDDHCDGWNR